VDFSPYSSILDRKVLIVIEYESATLILRGVSARVAMAEESV
jgi:hypothetical protein